MPAPEWSWDNLPTRAQAAAYRRQLAEKFETDSRAALGSAYDVLDQLPQRPSGSKVNVPALVVETTAKGHRVMVERWTNDMDGWDADRAPVSGVYHGSWGEAQAELTRLLPRREP